VFTIVRKIFYSLVLALFVGCATRSFTTPHSQVVAAALAKGEKVRTVEEDLALFKKYKDRNKQNLYRLIRERNGAKNYGVGEDYRLGPDDKIELVVFGVDDLNREASISQSGYISLPLAGGVKIGGLSVSEAEIEIKRKLGQYLRSPEVSISVLEFGSQKISVLGAVATPGDVLLRKGNNSLVKVLSMAGGTTDKAGSFLSIIPAGEGSSNDPSKRSIKQAKLALEGGELDFSERGIELPLSAVLGTSGTEPIDLPLIGGDVVIVPNSGQVQVEGEVEKRGTYILGEKMSLLGALAAAGGISYGANINEIEVIRKLSSNDKVVLIFDLEKLESGEQENLELKDGDVVRVPSSSGRRITQDVMQSLRQMINFGVGSNYRLGP
jgi:polysaccharide biosynthesis/export protein